MKTVIKYMREHTLYFQHIPYYNRRSWLAQLQRRVCFHNLERRAIGNEVGMRKKIHTALIYDGRKKTVSERKLPRNITLRTGKLHTGNCEVSLDTGSNT